MSQKSRIRKRLFNKFSQNLQLVKKHPKIETDPDFTYGYKCPICWRLFAEYDSYTSTGLHLTIEDVPPKSLGGKPILLTCNECNNYAGVRFESQLGQHLTLVDFMKGIPGVSQKSQVIIDNGIKIPGKLISESKDCFKIDVSSKKANPKEYLKLIELLQKGITPKVNLKIKGTNQSFVEVALLRIAYLLAYDFFGFGFLVNQNLMTVRNQILNPLKQIMFNKGIINSAFSDERIGVHLIDEPKDLKSFLVVFQVKTRHNKYNFGVVLPGPGEPGLNIYSNLERYLNEQQKKVPVNIQAIKKRDFISNPELVLAPHQYWRMY